MNTLQIEGGRLVDFATLPEFQPQSSILLKAIIRKGSLSPDGFQRYSSCKIFVWDWKERSSHKRGIAVECLILANLFNFDLNRKNTL